MTSYVEIEEELDIGCDIEELTKSLLYEVLEHEGCEYEAQINIVITDADTVAEYNREYRGIDSTTDVLSFPAIDYEQPGDFRIVNQAECSYFEPESGELILGDIVINVSRVYSQAEEYGHSPKREFAFLVTHSLFHLCGYDHETTDEASVMEQYQEEVLAKLGITRD